MAGHVIERELSGTRALVRFEIATRSDDTEIRRLLRDNPMPGRISISLKREPNYFADAQIPGERKQTIVARENGRIVCVGSCATRQRFVNGESRSVGYLGGLRLAASHAGRFDIVRRGYECFRELQSETPADFYFTSIAAGNHRARHFLERGLRGMPHYELVGELVTLLLPAARHDNPISGEMAETRIKFTNRFIAQLNEHNRGHQFAPQWSVEGLEALGSLGLSTADFHGIHQQGRLVASAALWDQRSFKQTVIHGYAPWLSTLRPAHNLMAHVIGSPRLPAQGAQLANAFISHLTAPADDPEILVQLLMELRRTAAQRGIELLTIALAAGDPRLAIIKRNFRSREYRSRIYAVCWPGIGGTAQELGQQLLMPEAALL